MSIGREELEPVVKRLIPRKDTWTYSGLASAVGRIVLAHYMPEILATLEKQGLVSIVDYGSRFGAEQWAGKGELACDPNRPRKGRKPNPTPNGQTPKHPATKKV